ncbi:ferredoxin-thioredoxin reductase catalytic subunit [Methanohalophilus euhalobius]|uniref:ferredoxin:thioredoxin reductase n=1 Tax=Methanohalophilus euhalobius TaxID=51203 RepID=A0A285FZN7_9EURY|nr:MULTISPECIES: ferredoxin-thioredoxin reductase catalytic domain-containing protein [Methanohalophilus]ODV49052.1 MAG: FtrB [Methanohalophilus sp. 2-GBenrich]RSD33597.1 MAG: FtrB [Methanohalophilus sp.]TCL12560.1 ferredoxin-thioredoxin reductase catalytic subunit [Methanohalophilus euhalobius]SNY16628.1 Ferredoxin-thioredoxin reductase, catalytic subunit [Methanohalophilus euhalobius]
MKFEDELEMEFYERSKKNAETTGYKLNSDYDVITTAVKNIANNKRKYGEWYCFCQKRTGDKEKDKKIICPCARRARDVETRGSCKCGLYIK